MAVDVKTGEERMLLEDARIGEIVFNPVDRSLLGVRHNNGVAALVRIPYPYTQWTRCYAFPYEYVPYDLDISPDGRLLSASVSEVNGDQFLRVWELDKLLRRRPEAALASSASGSRSRRASCSPGTGATCTAAATTPACPTSSATRWPRATVEAVSNAETGFFRPVPLADGRLLVLTYTGEGFVPAIIEPRPLEDVSAITFLGAEVAAKYPVVKTWQVPPPSTVDDEKRSHRQGPVRSAAQTRPRQRLSGAAGLQELRSGSATTSTFADPLAFAKFGITAAYTPSSDLPGDSGATWNHRPLPGLAGGAVLEPLGFLRPLRPDQAQPQGLCGQGWATTDWLIYDEPRQLDVNFDFAYYDQIDTLPNAQNVDTNFTRLVTGEVGLHYTDVQRSLGAVDDEKGLDWALVSKGAA